MNNGEVVSLNLIKDINRAEIGSKAAGLVRLKQSGFSVPSGFCIGAAALKNHLKNNDLDGQIADAVSKIESTSVENRKVILSEIRRLIVGVPITQTLNEQIESHYHLLKTNLAAIRSSATAEDLSGYSFAGQYETYLGIADLPGCIDAAKKCWASLWTERAYEYRQKNRFNHMTVDMAVIVQSLVEADASGVIFTADPINGYKSRMIIETVAGLGDSLVSGRAAPRRFVVAKKKSRIVSRNFACDSCITDSVVKRLAKLGEKIEKHFNGPQDIEWAMSNDKIFFLQSRPITAIPQQKSWQERQVWTNANAGEVVPDVVTPMTWSTINLFVKKLLDSFFGWCGFEVEDNPMFGLIAGRAYFNLNTAIGMGRHFPEKLMLKLNDSFGGKHHEMFSDGLLDIPEENVPKIKFHPFKLIVNIPIFIFSFLLCTKKKSEAHISRISSINDKFEKLNINGMSAHTLAVTANAAIKQQTQLTKSIGIIKGVDCFLIFSLICSRWLKDDNLANKLLVGVGNMEDAQAGRDIWKIAAKADSIAEVKKIINTSDRWQDIEKKLCESKDGQAFLKSWFNFMARHGHHCRGEAELYNPRWSEMPDYILNLVRSYINNLDQHDFTEKQSLQIIKQQQLLEQCNKKLKNPFKRMLFKYFLKHAQQAGVFRENWKNQIVRCIAIVRKILLNLGKKLQEKTVFDNHEDIFFLKFEEIELVIRNKAEFDIKKTIASRRGEYEKNKLVTPPKVVIGKFNPDNYTPDAIDTDAEQLTGLAVSSGMITGKARVILKADTNEQVLPGEILVAPFTDPGWTPYFISAAAIVMDMGGMLSHGSIIAREYGIPAVVNVGSATKIIKTGQTIQVDANRGVVKIIL